MFNCFYWHRLGLAKRNDQYDLQSAHMVEIILPCPSLFSESLQGRRPVAPNKPKCSKANRNWLPPEGLDRPSTCSDVAFPGC